MVNNLNFSTLDTDQMTVIWQITSISIEDVCREVKILKALSGHKNLVKFYDAFEDARNVYIVVGYVFPFSLSFRAPVCGNHGEPTCIWTSIIYLFLFLKYLYLFFFVLRVYFGSPT